MSDQRNDEAYTREGEELTGEILAIVAPMVDGKSTKMILQVMAGVVLATVLAVSKDAGSRNVLLRRLAGIFNALADGQRSGS